MTVTVPFLTTISPEAETSAIQHAKERSRLLMNLFRSAFYRHADITELARRIEDLTRTARPTGLRAAFVDMLRFVYSSEYETF